jgi:hypothetical protein
VHIIVKHLQNQEDDLIIFVLVVKVKWQIKNALSILTVLSTENNLGVHQKKMIILVTQ